MHHEHTHNAHPEARPNDVPECVASLGGYDHKCSEHERVAPFGAALGSDLQDLARKPDKKTAATDIIHSAKALGRSGERCHPSIPQQGERK